jgi:hypothetical protein
VEYADLCFDDAAPDAIAAAAAGYVRGGVSILVSELATLQVAA